MQDSIFPLLITLVFFSGYLLIALEQVLRIDKTAVALLMAIGCWALIFANPASSEAAKIAELQRQFLDVCEVTTFILAILVIIELVQINEGFVIITERLRLRSKRAFFWAIGLITFFLSTMIANVTATIIMMALVVRFLPDKEDRMVVGAGIVIASNAGGAWTPIGDITTTMLWIADRVTSWPLMRDLFLPSFVSMAVTFSLLTPFLKGDLMRKESRIAREMVPNRTRKIILFGGLIALTMIPFTHAVLDFPAYLGAIFGAGGLWILADYLHNHHSGHPLTSGLARVDLSTYFFFLGILLSVRALDTSGVLAQCYAWITALEIHPSSVAILLGFVSSIMDNIPLVAASLGVYSLEQFPRDSLFWQLLAYCAGVGGSILIIGSPAGIAYMNIERVSFLWFLRKITLPVIVGYFAGVGVYLLFS